MNNFDKNLEAEIEIEISQALGFCFHDKLNYFICVDPESHTISNQAQENEYTIFEFKYKEIFGDNELTQDDFFIENSIENWEQFFYKNWDSSTISEIRGEAIKHIEYQTKIEVEYQINNMDSWEFEYLDDPIDLALGYLKKFYFEGESVDDILILVNEHLKELDQQRKDELDLDVYKP